jgi:hypothetical protein
MCGRGLLAPATRLAVAGLSRSCLHRDYGCVVEVLPSLGQAVVRVPPSGARPTVGEPPGWNGPVLGGDAAEAGWAERQRH